MNEKKSNELILGLDIGANSIGWALVKPNGKPIATGVRVFEAGMEGSLEQGKEESRAKTRRERRLQRRQLKRHRRRLINLFKILHKTGLFPQGDAIDSLERDKYIKNLDAQILPKLLKNSKNEKERQIHAHLTPYLLRSKALDEKLELYELGRALYHLAQRRGFKSARTESKDDEEKGKVKPAINKLEADIAAAKCRTLGEYFAKLNPEEERIRTRYTSRKMYEDEFEQIWESQKKFYPNLLTDKLKKEVKKAIFFQRKLKSQKHLIGKCELEQNARRAPWALLESQRFRMLQTLNNLCVITPDGESLKFEELPEENRKRLIDFLEINEKASLSEAKKLLGFDKKTKTNFEKGDVKHLIGNKTAAKLFEIFGERWLEFSEKEKNRIIEDLMSIEKDSVLLKRAKKVWGLDDENARKFANLELQPDYCNFSRRAIKKLLPLMEKGVPVPTAIKQIYGDILKREEIYELLPSVDEEFDQLRNPVVKRALTELRKIVNNIVKNHGKPQIIRVELARDAKRSKKERKELHKVIQENEKFRAAAAKKITDEVGIQNPTNADITKAMLHSECGGVCPYTGKHISFKNLFSDSPEFDVEHIIPFHRSLDNSFANKTLCYAEENRKVKRNRTPFEAYSGDEIKYSQILARVDKFQSKQKYKKLRLFKMNEEQVKEHLEKFGNQKLNDTRYASKLACEYLGLLYGGVNDPSGKERIFATTGGLTAHIRNALNLNSILGDGGQKSRDDHRHHAVDAIAIALTEPSIIKALSDAAESNWEKKGRSGAPKIDPPYQGFLDDCHKAIAAINVSHRVSKKVSGPLHEESLYGKPYKGKDGKTYVHIRKPLTSLSKGELENIVDPKIRKKVKEQIEKLGGDPKKFDAPENLPFMETKDGRKIPIKKARIRKVLSTEKIGKGATERNVALGSNHHIEILEVKDKKGNIKWDGVVVSTYEAMRRLKAGEPIIQRNHGENKKFLFSLANSESVIMQNSDGERKLFESTNEKILCRVDVIRKDKRITFRLINDARQAEYGVSQKALMLNSLKERKPQKVVITPLGEIRKAND